MKVCITCDELTPCFRLEILERLTDLLGKRGIIGTFFVVPNWHGKYYLGDTPEWCNKIIDMKNDEHEIGLHGYFHNFMEMGFPFSPFPGYKKQFEKIKKGKVELEELIGVCPVGFRGPWFSGNQNTIKALEDLGFRYDSSRVEILGLHTTFYALPKLYKIYSFPLISKVANKVDIDLYNHRPHKIGGTEILEIPIRGEYTWLLPKNTSQIVSKIARRDYLRAKKRDDVFVLITHVSGLTKDGFKVLKDFIGFTEDDGADFLTLEQISKSQKKNSLFP